MHVLTYDGTDGQTQVLLVRCGGSQLGPFWCRDVLTPIQREAARLRLIVSLDSLSPRFGCVELLKHYKLSAAGDQAGLLHRTW